MVETIRLTRVEEALGYREQVALCREASCGGVEQRVLTDEQGLAVTADLNLINRAVEIIDHVTGLTAVIGIASVLAPAQIAEINVGTFGENGHILAVNDISLIVEVIRGKISETSGAAVKSRLTIRSAYLQEIKDIAVHERLHEFLLGHDPS